MDTEGRKVVAKVWGRERVESREMFNGKVSRLVFFFFFFLFMREAETWQGEKQARCGEPNVGLNPRTP